MIWINSLFMISIMNLKEFLFFSSFLELENINNFILVISTFLYICLMYMKFSFIGVTEKLIYWTSMFLINFFSNAMFLTTSMIYMLILIEMTVYPMMSMYINQSTGSEKMKSVMFMFLTNNSGSMMMIIYIFKTEFNIFSMDLSYIQYMFMLTKDLYMLMFFTIMLLTKVPLMFMQFWLSKAHVTGSSASSMVLAALMLKLGTYGLFKFNSLTLAKFSESSEFLFSLGALGCLLMSLLMIRYTDMKLLVAYSSVLHMSLMAPMILGGSSLAITGSIFIMVSHGLISGMFFFYIGILYEMSMSRSIEHNKSMESFDKKLNLILIMMVFMNLGIPPFINFLSEVMIMAFSLKFSIILNFVVAMTMVLSIFFCMFMVVSFNLGKKNMNSNKNTNMYNLMGSALPLILLFLPYIFN